MKKTNPYIAYLKDNPKGYWFKRRLFGWGWFPVKWQGWAVTLSYIAALILLGLTIDENSPKNEVFFMFELPLVLLTVALIRICYKKGEKPKWQWGLPEEYKDTKKEKGRTA